MLLGLLPGGRTAINERLLAGLRRDRLDDGFELLKQIVPPEMRMPPSRDLCPTDDHFLRGLRARGWQDAAIESH